MASTGSQKKFTPHLYEKLLFFFYVSSCSWKGLHQSSASFTLSITGDSKMISLTFLIFLVSECVKLVTEEFPGEVNKAKRSLSTQLRISFVIVLGNPSKCFV